MHLSVPRALPSLLPEGLQHPSCAKPTEDTEERKVNLKKQPGKTTALITKSIYQYENNGHTAPCTLGMHIPSRTKHAAGASRILIIVRYVLQQEGEPQGVALHGAGIRNGSASGCLPKALENLTSQRLLKDAFLLPVVLFGGLLPRAGCTVAKCRWEVSLLALQPLQLVLRLPDGTVTSIPLVP